MLARVFLNAIARLLAATRDSVRFFTGGEQDFEEKRVEGLPSGLDEIKGRTDFEDQAGYHPAAAAVPAVPSIMLSVKAPRTTRTSNSNSLQRQLPNRSTGTFPQTRPRSFLSRSRVYWGACGRSCATETSLRKTYNGIRHR